MGFQLPTPMRNFLKTTSFWRDNYLILREFKRFSRIAILAIIFTIIGATFEGLTVALIASFLQGLTNPNEAPIKSGIHWLDLSILATEASPTERVYRLSSLILVAIWLRSGFVYLGGFYSRRSELNLGANLRQRLFEQLQNLSLSYYSKSRSGELLNSLTNEVNQTMLAVNEAFKLFARSYTLLIYLITMLCLSWQLSIIAVMMYGLLSAGLSNLIRRLREASFAVPKVEGHFTSTAIEFINGIRTVQASATQDFERQKFDHAVEELTQARIKVVSMEEIVKPLAEGFASTILIALITVSFVVFVISGKMQGASILTFMFILFRMMPLVSQVNGIRSKLVSHRGTMDNLKELLRTDDKIYLKNGSIPFYKLQESIAFVNVDFGYDPQEPVLRNLNLSIAKGQTIALVGASGAGKTTLADLIPRFYDPDRGKILIDGVDLKELDINSLRRRMAIVSQDTFIFNTSIKNNIAYGLTKVDEEAIEKAAHLANAWEFIQEMPEGLETVLGDRGVRLSGGQRQRIAIARALVRNPEILILDEATSALDSVTERLIQESLERLTVGRTVIAIAHRLSTIVRSDLVVVLEQGQIVEQGGYQELLDRRGKLWKYHQIQFELGQVS
jgi:ATP-binding cassette, subfamily B, bacterial MsbA